MSSSSDNDKEMIAVNKNIEKITCMGCLYNCPGQRDHMEEDGCLYINIDTY